MLTGETSLHIDDKVEMEAKVSPKGNFAGVQLNDLRNHARAFLYFRSEQDVERCMNALADLLNQMSWREAS